MIVARAKYDRRAFGATGTDVSAAEIRSACRLDEQHFADLLAIVHDQGLVDPWFDDEKGVLYLTLRDASDDWSIWQELAEFSKKSGIPLNDLIVRLKFALLDD